MTTREILKDAAFEPVSETRMDAKHRVTLGRLVSSPITGFRIYRNAHGQFILDPLVTVPAHEAWLFQNPQASALVHKGLEDAKRGRVSKAKEDFTKYVDDQG